MKSSRPVLESSADSSPSSSEDPGLVLTKKIDYFGLCALIVFPVHSLSMRLTRQLLTVYGAIVLVLLFGIPSAAPQKTHKLFWDDKNPVFNHGNNKMFVEQGDDITIVCPYNSPEHNNIYWTKNRDAYDQCDHTSDKNSIKLITCEPYSTKDFNIQVTGFSWVSLNPNFLPGEPIYLLSQPNFCNRYNMRIVIILKSRDNKEKLKEAAAPEKVIQRSRSSSIIWMWSPMIIVLIALFSPWS